MAALKTLRIKLPTSLRKLVEARVRDGEFSSTDELIAHSLRLFQSESRHIATESRLLGQKIAERIRQSKRRELVDAESVFRQLKGEVRRERFAGCRGSSRRAILTRSRADPRRNDTGS